MAFFFTEKDDSLLLSTNGRDPMGVLPVWQSRAHQDIVPHLTAASTRIEGFQVLLILLAWWPEFAHTHAKTSKDIYSYFILAEQAIARACKVAGHDWLLPGKRRLNTNNKELYISLNKADFLMDNQLATGIWGIYRGPASRVGLVDLDTNQIPADMAEAIRALTPAMPQLFNFIHEAITKRPESVHIASRATHQLVKALSELIKNPPLAPILKEYLLKPVTGALTIKIVELLDQQNTWLGPEKIIAIASQHFPEDAARLCTTIDCERYLSVLEHAFEWLCGVKDVKTISLESLANKLPVDLPAWRVAQHQFAQTNGYEGVALKRHRQFANEIMLDNKQTLIRSLIKVHEDICKARKNASWLELSETGKLEIRVPQSGQPDKKKLDPSQSWRNDYYLDALQSLVRQYNPLQEESHD